MTPAIGHATSRGARGRRAKGDAPAGHEVRVWLFGGLSPLTPVRPMTLRAPSTATVGSVIDDLGRVLGPEFLSRILDSPGRKLCTCRVFLDGLSVELDDPLPSGQAAHDLELIVLTAVEGG